MEPAARERLLDSMLLALAEQGHGAISLAAVLERTGVSEAEYAVEYADLDACLHAAYEQLTARIDAVVRAGCGSGGEWPARVRGGLQALLGELAGNPQMARVLTRTFPSIDLDTQARYQAFVESFGPMLAAGRGLAEADELPREVEALAVGAAEAIIFEQIESGRAAQLQAMAPSILFSVLVPFLGPGRAAAEMEKAQQGS
jgi:AcrR family transcriptional regulator